MIFFVSDLKRREELDPNACNAASDSLKPRYELLCVYVRVSGRSGELPTVYVPTLFLETLVSSRIFTCRRLPIGSRHPSGQSAFWRMHSFRADARGGTVSISTAQSSEELSSGLHTYVMMTPMASSSLQPPQTSDYLPSISPSVVYSTAHAVWTSQELQLLHKGLADFPAESYDNVTRYIKIAATLPGKCVRDVAFRVKAQSLEVEAGRELYTKRVRIDHIAELANMASQQPLDDVQLNALFQDNIHAINTIRNNLLNGKANENKDVMVKFRDNCHSLMTAIGDICSTIPPLPVKLDMSLVTGSTPQHQ